MVAPSISGLTNLNLTASDFAVATTSSDYPSSGDGFAFTAIANQSAGIRITGSSGTVDGDLIVAEAIGQAFDFTNQNIFIPFSLPFALRLFDDPNAWRIGWVDTAGVYEVFHMGGASELVPLEGDIIQPALITAAEPASESNGSIDRAAIDTFIFGYRVSQAQSNRPRFESLNFFTFQEITLSDGDDITPGNFGQLSALLAAISAPSLFYSLGLASLTGTSQFFECVAPVVIQCERFSSTRDNVRFVNTEAFVKGVASGYYMLRFEPITATSIQTITEGNFFSNSEVDFEISASADPGATITISGTTVNAPGNTIVRSPATITGGSSVNRTSFHYQGGTVTGHAMASGTPLVVDCTPGDDLSTVLTPVLEGANPILRLNPSAAGASPINLSGLSFTGELDVRNDTANAITVALPSGALFTTANNTGGVVTIPTEQVTVTLNGIPDVPNAIVYVQDLNTLDVINPTVTSGVATFTPSLDRNYRIRAKAPGYLASNFITINPNNTREFTFDLEDYRALYESGTADHVNLVFDPATFEITVRDGQSSYSFATAIATLEEDLSTAQGIQFTAHPFPVQIAEKNVLVFPYDIINSQVNPAKILPHASNTTDPALDFEVFKQSAPDGSGVNDSTYDLFDFITLGNGRFIRVRTSVAIAEVSVSGGLSPEDRAVIDSIDTNVQAIPTNPLTDQNAVASATFALINPELTAIDAAIAALPSEPIQANITQVAGNAISGVSDFHAAGFSSQSSVDAIADVIKMLGYTSGQPASISKSDNTTTITVGSSVVTIEETDANNRTVTRTA